MVLEILCMFISILVSISSLKKVRRFPDETLSVKENSKKIGFYLEIDKVVDIILILLIDFSRTDGVVYEGSNLLLVALVIGICYEIPYRKIRRKAEDKMKEWCEEHGETYPDVSRKDGALIVKTLLFTIALSRKIVS